MRTIRTERVIEAPRDVVWDELADLSSYRDWNPHIVYGSGTPREDGRVTIRVSQGGGRARAIPVRVTRYDPPRLLSWRGRVVAAPLFEGEHTFELHELADDRTRLVNREVASGLLVPLLVYGDPELDYEAMNDALARRAEERFASAPNGAT
jgi:hypothetical protein